MSAHTKIEWCDYTFNPWIGCTKVSPGCANCYAEGESKRRGWAQWGKGKERHRTSASYWKEPLRWNRRAEARPSERPRVFCASLADWLDDKVPIEWLADLLALIHATPNLDWLLLTKRPENFFNRVEEFWSDQPRTPIGRWLEDWIFEGSPDIPPQNIWLGVSVEDQKRADERIPLLLKIPASIHFLSCEPMLGKINLRGPFDGPQAFPLGRGIQWVIVGGESGPKARPCDVNWISYLVDQCHYYEMPVFVKQLGARVFGDEIEFPTAHIEYFDAAGRLKSFRLCDRKGGDPDEWPENLRVREFPKVRFGAAAETNTRAACAPRRSS